VNVVWTGLAVNDVEAHVNYLSQFNELAARELAISLFTAGDSLSAMPNRGRPGRIGGTRELVALYPYVIVYEVRLESVVIQRVWHGKLLA
jgi:toxin ParE1/3/4